MGYDKRGLPRLQTHHWNNCRVAVLRPGDQELVRKGPGRPATNAAENKNNMAANFEQETLPANLAPEFTEPFTTDQHDRATIQLPRITQPRSENVNKSLQNSKQFEPAPPSTSTPDPKPVTREPLPRQASGGLAPPVTKGAPQSSRSSSTLAPPSPEQAGQQVLHDHDYFRRPSAVLDHDYAAPGPPPGFENYQSGRPRRNINPPARFSDYDTS